MFFTKLVFESHIGSIPDDLKNLFTFSHELKQTNVQLTSGRNNLLAVPTIGTTSYGNKSLKFHCAKIVNEKFRSGLIVNEKYYKKSKVHLKNLHNKHQVSRALKKHFMYQYTLH